MLHQQRITWLVFCCLFVFAATAASNAQGGPPGGGGTLTYTWSPAPQMDVILYHQAVPERGWRWNDVLTLNVYAPETDTVTITEEGVFISEYMEHDSTEFVWTCSDGVFVETGTSTATNFSGVNWMSDNTPPDFLTVTCQMSDGGVVPSGDAGTRDDADVTDDSMIKIRFPKTISLRFVNNVEPDAGHDYAYANVVKVVDNHGQPMEGEYVVQDLSDFEKPGGYFGPEHQAPPADDTTIDWRLGDMVRYTDQQGEAYDICQYEGTELDVSVQVG